MSNSGIHKSGSSNLDMLKRLISSDTPFYESIWSAREKIFNHSQDSLECWRNLAKYLPGVSISNRVSKRNQFVATVVYNIERFKIALCEKQVLNTNSLQTLEARLRGVIESFKDAGADKYMAEVLDTFRAFFYRDCQDILVSERARVIPNGNGKAKTGLIPVLIRCRNDECLFIGNGMQERKYLNFDLLAAYKDNRKWLVNHYAEAFAKIQKDYDKPLTICFRKKYAGAYGIIRLQDDISRKLPDNPIAVYSQSLDRIEPTSQKKNGSQECVLLGDVVVTGRGVARWRQQMENHGYSVRSIIIFAEFGDKQKATDYPQALIKEVVPSVPDKLGEQRKVPRVYSVEDLDGRFAEPLLEQMFMPNILKQGIT